MQQGQRYAWSAYAAICIMAVVWTGIQFNCMNLYAAPVVEEMGITRTAFMVVLSIPAVISAVISLLFFGTIEERVGMRKMLLIGGILNTLAFVSWSLMDSPALLYLGGTLYGFGCSITAYNSVAAGVNRWFKQRTGTLMGTANALGNVAGIVFSLVIALLIASVGWRYSFGICIVLSAVATIACVMLYKGNPGDLGVPAMYAEEVQAEELVGATADEWGNAALDAEKNTATIAIADTAQAAATRDDAAKGTAATAAQVATVAADAAQTATAAAAQTATATAAAAQTATAAVNATASLPFKQELRTPRIWLLALGYLLLGTTTYGIMSTLPLFAVDLGFAQLQGQTVSVSLLAAAIAMVPLGMVCDRFGVRWAIALTSLLMIVAAILLRMPALPFGGMLLAAALSGAAYSACGVAVGTGVKEAFGETDFGKKLGLCSGCMYIGLAAGPALINLAYDTMGTYSLALIAFIFAAVVMAAIFFITLKRSRM